MSWLNIDKKYFLKSMTSRYRQTILNVIKEMISELKEQMIQNMKSMIDDVKRSIDFMSYDLL